MEINKKEIDTVISLEPFERYSYFLKRAADNEKVYVLENIDSYWASSTIKGFNLYPIWPAKEFAMRQIKNEWADFQVVEVDLYVFLNDKLSEIIEDGFLLNVFPVDDKTGFVVKPDEFTRDLNKELENYE